MTPCRRSGGRGGHGDPLFNARGQAVKERAADYATTDADDAAAVLNDKDAWRARLQATLHIHDVVGDRDLVVGPRATEACGGSLDAFVWGGGLAVGDAALSFDPLSSQGILNALYTGLRGGQAVAKALGGDNEGMEAYAGQLQRVRTAYLLHHRAFYGTQRQWSQTPFWRKRRGTGR